MQPLVTLACCAMIEARDRRLPARFAPKPGRRHLVALVGPDRRRQDHDHRQAGRQFPAQRAARVGLITVDTYRIAAVEQLRTYADIIDLPMEVVSTPREMREAVARLADLDLVLMDTAGRSPRDEVKIQELQVDAGRSRGPTKCIWC